MSTSGSKAAKLYASIAVDYNAAKSNPFKKFVEENTFSSAIRPSPSCSNLDGQHVLDLGCGSGHYCRILKNEWNASIVHGVDVSEHMLAEARRNETHAPLGIQYMQQDLLSSRAAANIAATFFPTNKNDAFSTTKQQGDNDDYFYDLVTAEYLFPYAANREELDQLCLNAASLIKPGGRFVSIVSICSDSIMSAGIDGGGGVLESHDLGWAATWENSCGDNEPPHDGMLVELTLFGEGRSSRASFPNYLWTKDSIDAALKATGFGQVEWKQMEIANDAPDFVRRAVADVEKTPVGVFVARRL
jgi:SAM-dependent methyltransferase